MLGIAGSHAGSTSAIAGVGVNQHAPAHLTRRGDFAGPCSCQLNKLHAGCDHQSSNGGNGRAEELASAFLMRFTLLLFFVHRGSEVVVAFDRPAGGLPLGGRRGAEAMVALGLDA